MMARPVMASLNLLVGSLILFGVWLALPARWLPVDVFGTLLALMFLVSGIGLFRGSDWAERTALLTGAVSLVTGITLVSVLAITAAQLTGLYGPVGDGGAILLLVVGLLVFPYLVVFPALQVQQLLPENAAAPVTAPAPETSDDSEELS